MHAFDRFCLWLFVAVMLCKSCFPSQGNTDLDAVRKEEYQNVSVQEEPKVVVAGVNDDDRCSDNNNNNNKDECVATHRKLYSSSSKSGWLQEDFPNPQNNPTKCRCVEGDRICDPDSILSKEEIASLETLVKEKCTFVLQHCTYEDEQEKEEQLVDLQLGIAIVRKMDLSDFTNPESSRREEEAAETFARYVHDAWGVGETTECGGTGILLFLSLEDRAMFLSRGSAIEYLITDRRLDRIIDNVMKPHLQEQQYSIALQEGIQQLSTYIIVGEPTFWGEVFWEEFWENIIPIAYISFIVLYTAWKIIYERRQQRNYAQVSSQLNELDRARAEALQGRYRTTSCPICLEPFVIHNHTHNNDNSSSNGDNDNQQYEGQEQIPIGSVLGSDGKPIKLLRCGHVFDECCWAEWVNSGQGNITKCPICQQDVGSSIDSNAEQQQSSSQQTQNNDNQNVIQRGEEEQQQDGRNRIIRQVYRERNFRLARLALRYPQFIRPQQIQRWTQTTYDGSLVRDPSFVNSNPRLARTMNPNSSGARSSSGGGGSFGGGASGGGRGGRW